MFRMPRVLPRVSRVAIIAAAVLLVIVALGQSTAQAALDPGAAIVRADGDCLRMRAQPSLQGTLLACIPDGSTVTVLAGNVAVDGFQWQRISFAGQTGWSVDQFLQPIAGPAPTSIPTTAPTTPPSTGPIPTPTLNGALPAAGGFGLAVWGGGPIDRIPPLTAARGCTLRAVWVTSGGDFVGYVYGAPSVVNARWVALYQDNSLVANTAIIVVCASASSGPAPTAVPTQSPGGPVATPGVPPGTPNTPPGPAGNR